MHTPEVQKSTRSSLSSLGLAMNESTLDLLVQCPWCVSCVWDEARWWKEPALYSLVPRIDNTHNRPLEENETILYPRPFSGHQQYVRDAKRKAAR